MRSKENAFLGKELGEGITHPHTAHLRVWRSGTFTYQWAETGKTLDLQIVSLQSSFDCLFAQQFQKFSNESNQIILSNALLNSTISVYFAPSQTRSLKSYSQKRCAELLISQY